jgi:hypothetical protein
VTLWVIRAEYGPLLQRRTSAAPRKRQSATKMRPVVKGHGETCAEICMYFSHRLTRWNCWTEIPVRIFELRTRATLVALSTLGECHPIIGGAFASSIPLPAIRLSVSINIVYRDKRGYLQLCPNAFESHVPLSSHSLFRRQDWRDQSTQRRQ